MKRTKTCLPCAFSATTIFQIFEMATAELIPHGHLSEVPKSPPPQRPFWSSSWLSGSYHNRKLVVRLREAKVTWAMARRNPSAVTTMNTASDPERGNSALFTTLDELYGVDVIVSVGSLTRTSTKTSLTRGTQSTARGATWHSRTRPVNRAPVVPKEVVLKKQQHHQNDPQIHGAHVRAVHPVAV